MSDLIFNLPSILVEWALLENRPLSVQLELTYRCNFKCVHCLQPEVFKKRELSLHQIKKLLDELSNLGVLYLTLSGGEPFLREDFIKILEYAAKKKFLIRIKTNGSLITKEIIKKIKYFPIINIDLSLYGLNEITYEKITKNKRAFKKVMHALLLLKDTDIPITLVSVPLKENIKENETIIELARSYGFKPGCIPYITPKLDGSHKPLEHVCSQKELAKVFKKSRAIQPKGQKFICAAGHISFSVNPYGDVFPCMEWVSSRAGNIIEEDIKKIWDHSNQLKWVRSLRPKDLDKLCGDCKFFESCYIGRCPARAFECKKNQSQKLFKKNLCAVNENIFLKFKEDHNLSER